jgi:hypothetical protein
LVSVDPSTTLLLPSPPTPAPAAPRRSGRRRVVLVVVLLLVMALCGMVAGGLIVKQRAIASAETQLQVALGTPEPPTVSVASRPSQLLQRDIDRIDVSADAVGSTNAQKLLIRHLDVRLQDVTLGGDLKSAVAQRVTGAAQIDYSALSSLTGQELSGAGDGRIAVTMHKTVIDVVASGRPSLDAAVQTITFADTHVEVAGLDIPDSVVRLVQSSAMDPLQLDGVPMGLKVVGIDVADSGVTVQLDGSDVVLTR